MAGLVTIKYQTEDAARSPELRYLESCRRAEAESVFGEVEDHLWRPQEDREAEVTGGVPVLVIGRENVHLGARSLRHMKAALDRGAGAVLPGRLASFAVAEETPIHSLRGFEGLERRILEEGLAAREVRGSHLPVALFSAEVFAEKLRHLPLRSLLTDPRLLDGLAVEPARVGVFHDYVDYYGEVRDDVLPFLPEGVRDVLEVGCGRGMTGRLLQERRGCRVTGVELNPEVAAEASRHLHRVIVGDVEKLEIDGPFDAVVATELFEHLAYPESFLAKVGGLLRPGGRIVLSVPNVGHYSIVEDLLAGRWDYLPIGLLCYTHFRFFTSKTLASWIRRAGFPSFEITAQKTDLPERFARFPDGFEIDRESLSTQGFYVVIMV